MAKEQKYVVGKGDCKISTVSRILLKCTSCSEVVRNWKAVAGVMDLKAVNISQIEKNAEWSELLTALVTSFCSRHGKEATLESFIAALRDVHLNDAADELIKEFPLNMEQNHTAAPEIHGGNQQNVGENSPSGSPAGEHTSDGSSSNDQLLSKYGRGDNEKRYAAVRAQKPTKLFVVFSIIVIFIVLGIFVLFVVIYFSYENSLYGAGTTESDIAISKIPEEKVGATWQATSSISSSPSSSVTNADFAVSDVKYNVSANSLTQLNSKMAEAIHSQINVYLLISNIQDWQPLIFITNSPCIKFLHELVIRLGDNFQRTLSLNELNFTLHNIKNITILTEHHTILNNEPKKHVDIGLEFCKVFPNLEHITSDVAIFYSSFVRLSNCQHLKHLEAPLYFSDDESFWDLSSLFDQPSLKSMKLELIFAKCPLEEKIGWLGLERIREKLAEQSLTSNCNLYTNYTRQTDVLYSSHYENKTAY